MATLCRWALGLMLSMVLAGCGGDSYHSVVSGSSAAEPAETKLFEGRAVKGVVRHGVLEAHEYVAGNWQLVGTGFTDERGFFDIDLSATSGPVKITILAGPDTLIVCDATPDCDGVPFGDDVLPPDDFRLIALIPSSRTGGSIAVTPLTHLAARWVESMPAGLPVTDSLIELAISRVADLFTLGSDFAWQLPVDITDENERSGASSMLHELLGASFSSVAYQFEVSLQDVLEAYVSEFVGLAGQLLVESDLENLRPGLDLIHELALAAIELWFDEQQQAELIASVNQLMELWGHQPVTTAGGEYAYDQAEFDSGMVLLNDLDYYLSLAGIDDSASFLSTQMAQIQWLYNTPQAKLDTSGLLLTMLEGVMFGVIGAMSDMFLSQVDEEALAVILVDGCIDLSLMEELAGLNLEEGYVRFCPDQSMLVMAGERRGQQVDVIIDVSPLSLDGPMQFTLRGSEGKSYAQVQSTTSLGRLGGSLSITLEGLENMTGMMDLLALRVVVAIEGSGSLAPDAFSDGFQVSLDAGGAFDMAALVAAIAGRPSDAPIVTLQINDGELTSPYGDRLEAVFDEPFCQGRLPLYVEMAAESSMQACFGFEAFGLPEMHMTVGGTLSGLFDFIGQVLSGLGEFDGSFANLINGLDPTVLALLGDARLKVLDHENGERLYAFGLDNNRLDVSTNRDGVDHSLSIFVTSLNGGYIFSGSTLVATIHSDWQQLGATLRFADGREDRSYFLGNVSDVVDQDLIELLMLTLFGAAHTLGGLQL